MYIWSNLIRHRRLVIAGLLPQQRVTLQIPPQLNQLDNRPQTPQIDRPANRRHVSSQCRLNLFEWYFQHEILLTSYELSRTINFRTNALSNSTNWHSKPYQSTYQPIDATWVKLFMVHSSNTYNLYFCSLLWWHIWIFQHRPPFQLLQVSPQTQRINPHLVNPLVRQNG